MLPRRVSLGYATTLLGVVGALLNNLWLLAAVADEVSKSELGLYLFAAATIGYFALTQLGLDAASAQRIAEAIGRKEKSLATRIYYQISYFNNGICLLVAACTTIATVTAWFFAPAELRDVACWIVASTGLGTTIRLFANPARAALNGAGNVHLVGIVGLMTNLLTPVLGYILLKNGAGVLCLPFSQFITALLAMLILHLQRIKTCSWSRERVIDRWDGFSSLFKFGVGVSGSIALAMLVATCEPILFKLASSEALLCVAVYHIWFRFPAMTFVLSSGLTHNSGPALATAYARDASEGITFFRRLFWIATGIGAICTFAVVSWLTPFVHHWLNGKYDLPNGISISLGFGVLIGFRAILLAVASFFYPLNRIRDVVCGYAIQAGSKIILGLCLIPFFSIRGMVWAYALSTFLAAAWLLLILIRRDVVKTREAVASFSSISATASLGWVVAQYTENLDLKQTIVGIGITTVCLALIVFATFCVTQRRTLTTRHQQAQIGDEISYSSQKEQEPAAY